MILYVYKHIGKIEGNIMNGITDIQMSILLLSVGIILLLPVLYCVYLIIKDAFKS